MRRAPVIVMRAAHRNAKIEKRVMLQRHGWLMLGTEGWIHLERYGKDRVFTLNEAYARAWVDEA